MRNNDKAHSAPVSGEERTQPIVLIAQLLQETTHMRQANEVFSWLAQAMTQRWHIPVVQLWTPQNYRMGHVQTELQATASQRPALPQQVHMNRQTAAIVEHFLREQKSSLPLPVTSVFPAPQAQALARYRLHYWAGYFLKNENLSLPASDEARTDKVATPLSILATFFTQSIPSPRLLRSIGFLTDQAVRIAIQRGFLTPKSATSSLSKLSRRALSLNDLIPQNTQDLAQFQAQNPFSHAVIIPDRKARHLYAAIDGKKNVAQLAQLGHLDQKEISEALHYLFDLQQIRFHTPEGEIIDGSPFQFHKEAD